MPEAVFRFYAELNDFLRPSHRRVQFHSTFNPPVTVKHLIESLGVPHTEIDLILVNGEPVGFDYQVKADDRISVYPVFEALDISLLNRLHPRPLRNPRFVLDAHLGRLAACLRMLGFDALYQNDYRDEELARISADEGRILLTRDRGLLKRKEITRGSCVHSTDPDEQVREVIRRFDLVNLFHPFSRCLRCNGLLWETPKNEVLADLQPGTEHFYDEFYRCDGCGQVYWRGTHVERMQKMIQNWIDPD
jgi:uncharacterized protein with PIN domain/sulfur carrier protein ThiS